jgi:hypothetical protein
MFRYGTQSIFLIWCFGVRMAMDEDLWRERSGACMFLNHLFHWTHIVLDFWNLLQLIFDTFNQNLLTLTSPWKLVLTSLAFKLNNLSCYLLSKSTLRLRRIPLQCQGNFHFIQDLNLINLFTNMLTQRERAWTILEEDYILTCRPMLKPV